MATPTTIPQEQLIDALRLRYDYYSARTMFELALGHAGLPELPAYDAAQVQVLRTALAAVGDRLGAVEAQLDALLAQTAPAAQAAPAAPSKPAATREPAAAAAAPTPAVAAKLADEPATKLADEPAAKLADEPADEPAAKLADEPAAKLADEPAAKLADEPAAKLADEPATKLADEPAAKLAETDAAAADAPAGQVTLYLSGVPVETGVEVLICGSTSALGDWNAEHAVAMTRNEDAWSVAIDLAPGTAFDFKFLLRRGSGEALWERGENRTAVAASRVECDWR